MAHFRSWLDTTMASNGGTDYCPYGAEAMSETSSENPMPEPSSMLIAHARNNIRTSSYYCGALGTNGIKWKSLK